MLRREGYDGAADDDQRGRLAAVRPAEPVQGLPRGHGAGRLDSAAAARILLRTPHRSRARHSACRRSTSPEARAARQTAGRSISARCCSRRAPTPCGSTIPGAGESQIHYLRTFADSRAIVANAATAKRAVVVGASFIGLEVAASLRTRGIDVHVVGARERAARARPGAGGRQASIRELHEGARRRLSPGTHGQPHRRRRVTLSDGTTLDADFIVLGVGVRPAIALAESAGLAIDRGDRRRRIPRDQHARHIRRRRHRALARSAFGRAHPRRALGGRAATGAGGGAKHPRPARALRRGAVLLEPALRCGDQLRRPRGEMGRDRDRRLARRARLRRHLPARRSHAGRRDDLPRRARASVPNARWSRPVPSSESAAIPSVRRACR